MKKNLYIIIFIILIVVIGIILYINNTKDVKIDINRLGEEIIKNINFDDEMNEADSETIKKIYKIENSISEKGYFSSGATTEEVVLFEFNNKNEAKVALKIVYNRIQEQKSIYDSYAPREVRRLDKSIIKQKGQYIIICITEDENIEKIIKNNIK